MLTIILTKIMFCSAFMSFIFNMKHILSALISLEFLMASLFLLLSFFSSLNFINNWIMMIFLFMSISEGALGIGVMIMLIRNHGTDYFLNINFLTYANYYNPLCIINISM